MSGPLLEAEDLVRWFDDVHAVNGVSFEIPAGEVVGLIGANGAGKTTMMRLLATLDVPERGVVRLGGIDIVEYPNEVRRRIGWMPDHFTAYKDTTVGDYIDFFGRAHGLHGQELRRRVDEVTEFTDLTSLNTRPMDKLSKGQTQRLCLARTLLNDPEFLAACEKRNLMVDGAKGEEIDQIVRDTLRLPQSVADQIGQMMQ